MSDIQETEDEITVTGAIRKQGNSSGVTLTRDVLEASGFAQGEAVLISAREGVVEIRKVDDTYADCKAAYAWVKSRYRNTLRKLAE